MQNDQVGIAGVARRYDILGGAGQLQPAFTLGNHAERAATEPAASGYVLETDDGTPASDYTYDARRLLADVAAGIEETTRIASEAHNVLSHPKLTEPPQ